MDYNNQLLNIASQNIIYDVPLSKWKLLKGLDPNNCIWDIGCSIVKISYMDDFYAEMHIEALSNIHSALAPIGVAPKLDWIAHKSPYIISVYEKIEFKEEPSAFESGEALAKAHIALEYIPIRKSFPWDGFYGEPDEFRFLIPLIKDVNIHSKSKLLLDTITCRPHTNPVHYIHRDLNPGNIIKSDSGVYIIDWDMTHGGHREDDVAMSLCCLANITNSNFEALSFCREFLNGYRKQINADWAIIDSPVMISSIALAGLRQAVSGWFSDKGNMSAHYWPNILNRLDFAVNVCVPSFSSMPLS
ncbi:MAG: Phosphotransferase enzyme family [Herbinix sp.]|jgi:serine/threonine protein kinase|nr:Phosphotransferase enzyme family [Herbinix sp.]